jgi:hypothetical protein
MCERLFRGTFFHEALNQKRLNTKSGTLSMYQQITNKRTAYFFQLKNVTPAATKATLCFQFMMMIAVEVTKARSSLSLIVKHNTRGEGRLIK